jgi:hypothetical protein
MTLPRLPAILLTVLALAAAPADARRVSQRVSGIHRICTYPNPNLQQRRRTPLVARMIGAGEPCPTRDPGVATSQTRPPPSIPPMAMLAGQSISGGRLICDYVYLDRHYARARRIGQTCPMTPHFTD